MASPSKGFSTLVDGTLIPCISECFHFATRACRGISPASCVRGCQDGLHQASGDLLGASWLANELPKAAASAGASGERVLSKKFLEGKHPVPSKELQIILELLGKPLKNG